MNSEDIGHPFVNIRKSINKLVLKLLPQLLIELMNYGFEWTV